MGSFASYHHSRHDPSPLWTDKHLWQQYLPHTPYAGGKSQPLRILTTLPVNTWLHLVLSARPVSTGTPEAASTVSHRPVLAHAESLQLCCRHSFTSLESKNVAVCKYKSGIQAVRKFFYQETQRRRNQKSKTGYQWTHQWTCVQQKKPLPLMAYFHQRRRIWTQLPVRRVSLIATLYYAEIFPRYRYSDSEPVQRHAEYQQFFADPDG